MATRVNDSTLKKESKGAAPREMDQEMEVASVTTTTQGTPFAIKYERVVEEEEEEEEYNELEIEDELMSNDGSLFEDEFENEEAITDRSLDVSNGDEVDVPDQKKVIKLQTINVRGIKSTEKKGRGNKSIEVEDDSHNRVHVVKHEIESDEEYVYPPKKRAKTAASLRKKRRGMKLGRGATSVSVVSEKEAKMNVVRRTEETSKPRRILLQSGGSGGSKSAIPSSFRNASVQCNIPRLDPIKEGILAEMGLLNDLFKLQVNEILSRPQQQRRKRRSGVGVGSAASSWHQPEQQHANKEGTVDMLRVVKREITDDDTVEIIVCDSTCA